MTFIGHIDAWVETNPPLTNTEGSRSVTSYIECVKQFDVVNNPRYTPRIIDDILYTYCNIFLWDVTKALGCEIPHWVDANGDDTVQNKGRELNGNAVCDWMATHGINKNGWKLVSSVEANDRANLGYPSVVMWHNSNGRGHVAILMPGYDNIHIAQAGKHNLYDVPLVKGFGNVAPLKFYTHD